MNWEFSEDRFKPRGPVPVANQVEDAFEAICDAYGYIPIDHLPYCDWSAEGIRVARINPDFGLRMGIIGVIRGKYPYIVEFCPLHDETHLVFIPTMPDWLDFLNTVHGAVSFNLYAGGYNQ